MTAQISRRSLILARAGLTLGVLTAWELGAATGLLDPLFFSRPSAVIVRVGEWIGSGGLWPHLATTFEEALLSFAIGSVLGVLCGMALAGLPLAAALLEPYIRIGNALPRVVLAPIFLLWFGLGIWSKVALGVTVVFFVVFFNTHRGIRDVEPGIVANARMLGASDLQLFRHVLVPSALTWIFSSLHISVGMAIVAVVVGEYLGASRGVGYLIAQSEGVFDTTGVFAAMAVLAIGVLLVGNVVARLEQRLLRWKQQQANPRLETFA
jgi:NitT/TauT family transport system permease protein